MLYLTTAYSRFMPIIKSAIKKMRKDTVRTSRNAKRASNIKKLLKDARKNTDAKAVSALYSALDKAAKTHLIHKNKAARLKSRLAKKLTSLHPA